MDQPNNTLYFKNIDWKIKPPLLKRALYSLCTRHGKVLDVVALRRDGLRGQAWVVMESVQAANACLRAEQGFTFFGKDMVIEYARDKTKHVSKNGVAAAAARGAADGDAGEAPKAKKQKTEDAENDETEESVAAFATEAAESSSAPPSKFLLTTDLPGECNQTMLSSLFQQYNGFVEVRMPREGMAFVEFDSEASATLAMNALQGFALTASDTLKLVYGKE